MSDLFHFRALVRELNRDTDIFITNVVADMVERHKLRGLITINGRYSCEFCTCEGKTRVGGVDWPYQETHGKPLRTHEEYEEISRNGLHRSNEERKGIQLFSPLLDLVPPIDIVWDLPADEFHLCKEGLTKQILKRCFVDRQTVHSRRIHRELSDTYTATKVLSETSRRPRKLHILQMKGSEFGVLQFASFPALVGDILDGYSEFW